MYNVLFLRVHKNQLMKQPFFAALYSLCSNPSETSGKFANSCSVMVLNFAKIALSKGCIEAGAVLFCIALFKYG